jgi:uroporphyrinogen decarboxylase
MNSKKRVMATFQREKTDRIAVNYFGNLGINRRLAEHFKIKQADYEGLLKALGVDFRGINPAYTGPVLHHPSDDKDNIVEPLWGICVRWIEHSTGGYFDFCNFPLQDADEEAVANWPMPSPDDYDYEGAIRQCEHYGEYALYAGGGGTVDIINGNTRLRGMEQTLVDLATDNPAGLLLLDRRLEVEFEIISRTLEACKGKIDFLWIGEDLGTQIAPLISKALFNKHIRPRHQRFIDLAKSYNLPVMIHSCGSSSWAYNDFIEMGINAVDTLQPEAKDMSPQYLKKTFGDKLAFHGCISTAGPLAYGSRQDVEEVVRRTLDIMMPGGGYFMAPTHAIQDNTPVENVLAMYRVAHSYGRY